MHVNAKKIAFGGMLLALTIIFMMLGSIIETGTLFLLAAASFFVGIIWREFGAGSGVAFWGAGVLLGLFIAPNKFYVITYAVMGLYILIVEIVWLKLGRMSDRINRKALFWIVKYVVFNHELFTCGLFMYGLFMFELFLHTYFTTENFYCQEFF